MPDIAGTSTAENISSGYHSVIHSSLQNVKVWHATLEARLRGERAVQERCHHRLVRILFFDFDQKVAYETMAIMAIMIMNAIPIRLAAVFSYDCSASSLDGTGIEKIKSNSTVRSWSIK